MCVFRSVNVSSTTPRTNSRLASMNSAAKQSPSTPSTSRRSVRQNHVTRRRKSPVVVDKMNTANSLINANNASNNNNNTNKNNNNTKPSAANAGETCKNVNNEKNGVGVNIEKIESKSISKLNCVTKKEIVSQITTNSTNSIIDTKTNNGTNFAPSTATSTVTTRGNSVKQTHLINDSSIAAPPQDISHTHTVPVSEEVINTRRKTRSVANSNGNYMFCMK